MIDKAEFVRKLNLVELVPSTRTELEIHEADLNRPGMQFCDFYECFAAERPQLIGKAEMTCLNNMSPEKLQLTMKKYFSFTQMPCVIITRNMNAPAALLEAATENDIPVFRTRQITTKFTLELLYYLTDALAPHKTIHAVLLDVYGVGVLLEGGSGVGKSEAALELIKRGHQLVADDVVDIRRVNEKRLVGECPEMVRYFMEIRGIGIINVKELFGVGAVMDSKSIDFVIHMEPWNKDENYDRLGLNDHTTTILGVEVPYQRMPVGPGRNVAIIIEVAARNFSLRRIGYNAARSLLAGRLGDAELANQEDRFF